MSIAEPFAFNQYKKAKIREKIEQERPSRLKIHDNLPKVNRELAAKLIDEEDNKKKKMSANLLKDDRFKVNISVSFFVFHPNSGINTFIFNEYLNLIYICFLVPDFFFVFYFYEIYKYIY